MDTNVDCVLQKLSNLEKARRLLAKVMQCRCKSFILFSAPSLPVVGILTVHSHDAGI